MSREPGPGSELHPAHLLLVDHLERMPEGISALLLDLYHEHATPSTQDKIELISASASVGLEQAIPAEPIVTKGAALAAIHAAT